jgi:hypothetical protein
MATQENKGPQPIDPQVRMGDQAALLSAGGYHLSELLAEKNSTNFGI